MQMVRMPSPLTIDDLIGCLCSSWERFTKEL